MPRATDVRVERLPGLIERDAFSVAGFSGRFDQQTNSAIPALWERLMRVVPFAGQVGWETYGVAWGANREEGSFSYMAAGRLAAGGAPPPELERLDLPAGAYAVFRMTMAGGPPHPQFQTAMRIIWDELMPASGLVMRAAPDFELYADDRPPDQAGAQIDYYVPVVA
jgi:AraC family transcriptional regulator